MQLTLIFLLQTAEALASTVIPIVVLILTIGMAYGFSLSGSRTRAIIGAAATAYAALGPQLSSYTTLPNWLRIVLIVAGIAFTATNERIQGGASKPDVRAEEALKEDLNK